MPARFVTPNINIWGLGNSGVNEQLCLEGFNGDTGGLTLKVGDYCVQDRSATGVPALVNSLGGVTGSLSTTPNSKDPSGLGPVTMGDANSNPTTFAPGAAMMVCVAGSARVNATGAGASTLSILQTAATRRQVAANGSLALVDIGTIIGTALESSGSADVNGTFRCLIYRG